MSSIARQRPEVHTAFQGRYRFGNNEAPDQVEGRRPSESSPFGSLDHAYMARTDLTPSDKLVMMALPRWAGRHDQCFPSEATIAARIGVSSRTVRRALTHLLALQLIGIVPTKSNPTGRLLLLRYERPGRTNWPGKPAESSLTRTNCPPPPDKMSYKYNPSGGLEGRRSIDRLAAPVSDLSLEVGEGAGVLPPIQAAAHEDVALSTALEVVQTVAPPPPASITVAPPQAVPAAKTLVDRAKHIHATLYEGFCQSAAAADWTQWSCKYVAIARDLVSGALTQNQVELAMRFAQGRNDNRTRGCNFGAALKKLQLGLPLPNGRGLQDGEKPTFSPPRMSPADAARAVARYGNTSRQSLPQPAPYDPADRILSGAEFNEEMRRLCPDVYRQIDAAKAAKAARAAKAPAPQFVGATR